MAISEDQVRHVARLVFIVFTVLRFGLDELDDLY